MMARFTSLRLISMLVLLTMLAACGGNVGGSTTAPTAVPPAAAVPVLREPEGAVRLGFFPNVTHAQALVGLGNGSFAKGSAPSF